MNPIKQIDYPNYQSSNDDIFDKLIKRIRALQLIIDKNKQAWKYLLYGSIMIILGVITYLSTYGI